MNPLSWVGEVDFSQFRLCRVELCIDRKAMQVALEVRQSFGSCIIYLSAK